MPNCVRFAQTMSEKIHEIEINLRLEKLYKHHPSSSKWWPFCIILPTEQLLQDTVLYMILLYCSKNNEFLIDKCFILYRMLVAIATGYIVSFSHELPVWIQINFTQIWSFDGTVMRLLSISNEMLLAL